MNKPLVFVLVSVVSLGAFPALADERAAGGNMVSVRYADLDPSQTEDASTLLARLRRAADAACTPSEAASSNARLNHSVEACKADALDRVVAALDRRELSRLYAADRR
ncbi:MAG: UrcA family protein [Hyphomonadaceae bacterium]|nr:UrcA family protein [Hyphomonadaceae bacterium]